jgi:hypothetical protein
MPGGRAGRAVEAAAESIDRAEHSATLRIVMAGVRIAVQPAEFSQRSHRPARSGSVTRPARESHDKRPRNRGTIRASLLAPRT